MPCQSIESKEEFLSCTCCPRVLRSCDPVPETIRFPHGGKKLVSLGTGANMGVTTVMAKLGLAGFDRQQPGPAESARTEWVHAGHAGGFCPASVLYVVPAESSEHAPVFHQRAETVSGCSQRLPIQLVVWPGLDADERGGGHDECPGPGFAASLHCRPEPGWPERLLHHA